MVIDAPEVEQLNQAPPESVPTVALATVPKEIEEERSLLLTEARSLQIMDQRSYERGCEIQRTAAAWEKKATEFFEPMRKSTFEAYQTVLRRMKELIEPMTAAKQEMSRKTAHFQVEQERIRQEAQRKAEEEARRLAEEQRRRELEAAKKEGASKKELKALEQQPLDVQAPAVEPTYEKVASVSRPIADWSATPANGDESKALMELVKAVAQGKQPIIAVLPNYTYLNQQAKSLKELMRIPGWKATVSYRTSTRTGRK